MNKTWLLIAQNYRQKVRSKSFILLTLLYIAIVIGAMNWSTIKDVVSGDGTTKIVLVDETKQLKEAFPSTGDVTYTYSTDSETYLNEKVEEGTYDGALYVRDKDGKLSGKLVTVEAASFKIQQAVETNLDSATKLYAIQQSNLSPEQAANVLGATVQLEEKTLKQEESKSSESKMAGIGISYIVGFIMYLFVISYSSMITTDIASEKGSRVLEVLMSILRPTQHLMAKIISVFAVGFTQIALIAIVAVVAIKISKDDIWQEITQLLGDVAGQYVVLVIGFFLLTMLLYLTLGALMGSLVAKVEEAGQVSMPIMLLMMIGFFSLVTSMSSPDTLLVKVLSYIPFTSGMLMPFRFSATNLDSTYAWLSLGILAVTVIALFMLTVSLYKRSVLMYNTGGVWQKLKTVWRASN